MCGDNRCLVRAGTGVNGVEELYRRLVYVLNGKINRYVHTDMESVVHSHIIACTERRLKSWLFKGKPLKDGGIFLGLFF